MIIAFLPSVQVKPEPQAAVGERKGRLKNEQSHPDVKPHGQAFSEDGTVANALVCVDYLNGTCGGHDVACAKGELHSCKPYKWQVQCPSSGKWYNFP